MGGRTWADRNRDALGVTLPAYAEARIDSADLTDAQPTEYRADLVVLLVDGKPMLGIVVEVQLELKKEDRKFFTWPVYVANLRARLECPVCVLVVTPSETVAERARTPIELGPGSTVTPFMVGPKAVPVVRDADAAVKDPELAVLSAMAHGKERTWSSARATSLVEGSKGGASAGSAQLSSSHVQTFALAGSSA